MAWAVLCRRRMTTTPWGKASVIEEVTIKQGTTDREFATLVQLLENADGESLVRFSYSTDGASRRGPVTLRASDIHRLRKALQKAPRLRAALIWK
jgi:hypothetical protein